ncbi:MAG: 16S rRNA (uracil(1498)-N(3))-methyltransferase, partial [Planctomycetes bacterium]|nr:16S rRNA (uracil(1498)-N(3))-methyltransferase [Planctomycetota bacterium]
MNSIRLFCPNLAVGTSTVSEDEAHHAAVVLRARDGAAVTLFDGAGGEAAGTIVHISKRGLRVEVARVDQRPFDAAYRLTLAVAMGELVQIDGKLFVHANVEQQLRQKVA